MGKVKSPKQMVSILVESEMKPKVVFCGVVMFSAPFALKAISFPASAVASSAETLVLPAPEVK